MVSTIITIVSFILQEYDYIAIIPTVVCGAPILFEALKDAAQKKISAEALVITAMAGCLLLKEFVAAAEVAVIMSVGELLEDAVVSHARSGMDALGKLRADKANVVMGGAVEAVRIEDVAVGSTVRIFPGEIIPLDGIVISGTTSIDRSAVTGESVPADVGAGDEILAGTSNLYGSIDARVVREGSDSFVARMAKLLEDADAGKSRIASAADRWAKYILIGAAITAAAAYLFTGDIYRALTVMVVFCPCAFVLATPTGIMAAAGNMARHGILLRNASAIEGMSKVGTVIFDKTGTLTEGKMTALGFTVTSGNPDPEKALRMVSSLEARSDHPLAKAIAAAYEPLGEADDFMDLPGQGVVGTVDGVRIAAGNRRLMESVCPEGLEEAVRMSADVPFATVLVGMDGKTVGFISLEDRIKSGSSVAVSGLRSEGIRSVMLTGDAEKIGASVAETLGMDDAVWECTPDMKLGTVEYFESSGHSCMVGDGMNDAPALKRSTVGVSMGSMGNDMAVASSDIVFVDDDVGKVPGLLRLCRSAVTTISAGLALSMAVNLIGTGLAIAGEIGPMAGAIIHNGGSFAVILLAASLFRKNVWPEKKHLKGAAAA